MKFLLISNVLPPSESANAIIIYRLLRDLDADSYCLLSSRNYDNGDGPNYSQKLPGKHYYLPPPFQFKRGTRFGLWALRKRINLALEVVIRAWVIARILKREKCGAVVVVTGGGTFLEVPAAYLASRFARARFYPYLLDQYSQMVQYALGETFLTRFEAPVMKGAAAIITHNEFFQEEIRRRYQVGTVVIHNPCDLSEYSPEQNPASLSHKAGADGDGVRIVYTGGIGDLHYPAFQNLLAAIGSIGRDDVRLHVYTGLSEQQRELLGLAGPITYHPHVHISSISSIQQQADILFLPLGFETPSPEIVRTAAPGKMGEYLAAGPPVLVHGPPDSFIASYFRRYQCGVVVDQNDPKQLAEAILRLLSDADLRRNLRARAWARAEADFSLTRARAQFVELING